ncbi:MAG TPA: site-2 protease family protein [Patescibacteria group bacterium]|nr:site-2 protease family protein [Patescibacteria group bacterium]
MDIFSVVIGLVVLVFSAILHEVAHGFVADKLGDPTARLMGRLTLDPRKHIDPFLSIALPLLLILSGSPVIFGGAKPVPVDPYNLPDGRKDMAIVSLAGPLTNILLAIFASFLIKGLLLFGESGSLPLILGFMYTLLLQIVQYNILLAIFNLLPIPPLDGSKIIALALPEHEANIFLSLGQVGLLILFFLLVFPFGGFSLSTFINNIFLFCVHILLGQ